MKLLLLMLTIIPILSFKSFFKKYNNFILKSQNNDNNDNNDNKMPKILNIDFEELVNNMDKEMLKNFNGTIPRAPQIEEEIEKDSFEGYLQRHFNVLKNYENKIDFEVFLSWRKQIGTLLTRDELFNIYNEINKNDKYCDIMNFILINKIIDEVDGADF